MGVAKTYCKIIYTFIIIIYIMSQYLQQTQRENSLQVLDGSVRAKHTMIINTVVEELEEKIKHEKNNQIFHILNAKRFPL